VTAPGEGQPRSDTVGAARSALASTAAEGARARWRLAGAAALPAESGANAIHAIHRRTTGGAMDADDEKARGDRSPPHEAPDPGALPGKARDPLPRRPPNHPAPMPAPRPAPMPSPMPGPARSPMPGAAPQNQYKRITANRRAPAPSIPRPSPPGACPPAKAHPMASPAQRAEPPAPAPRSARSPGLRRADRHPGAPAPPPGPPAAVAAAAAAPARRPSPQPPAPPGPRPPTAQSHRTAGCARAA